MAIQTTYNSNLLPAVLGGRATEVPATVASRNVETSGGLGFGVPVMQGAGDKGVMAYTAPGRFMGITLLDRSATSGDWIPQYSSASVITKGDVWITAGVPVAAGDGVYLTADGAFTNVDTANAAIPNARWDTSTTAAGQLAVVRLG